MTNKMTYVQAIDFAISAITDTEVIDKLTQLKGSLTKKSSGEKKPTARQTENTTIKQAVFEAMESGKQYTISEMMKTIEVLADMSNQRVSAIVKQMKDEGLVMREEIKRKAYFTKVEGV